MNDDTHLVGLFTAFLTAAFFSIGGASALIPEFHRQIVDLNGWMNDADFVRSVALAQIAPGPNMLIVSLIGWHVAGLVGLVVSTLAILGPPSVLALVVGRGLHRLSGATWLKVVKTSLGPVVVGLMLASGLITSRAADHDIAGVALTLGAGAFAIFVKRNLLWVIAGGAITGLAGYHLGFTTVF